MVKEFYMSKGDDVLSPNFMLHEFQSNVNGGDRVDRILIDMDLLPKLESIRSYFGGSVIITSGYRTDEASEAVGGNAGDPHTKGKAADIMVYDASGNLVDARLVACYAQELGFNGIGFMGNAVHVDICDRHWWGDENGGNVSDWYDYFDITRPYYPTSTPVESETESVTTEEPNVVVQVNIGGSEQWLGKMDGRTSDITNEETGFGGQYGRTIEAVCVYSEGININYLVRTMDGTYLPSVSSVNADLNDADNGYAGIIGTEITGVWMEAESEAYDVEFSILLSTGEVMGPVRGKNFIGADKVTISGITAKIVNR